MSWVIYVFWNWACINYAYYLRFGLYHQLTTHTHTRDMSRFPYPKLYVVLVSHKLKAKSITNKNKVNFIILILVQRDNITDVFLKGVYWLH